MIETINIWRRSHDGRFSICIVTKLVDEDDGEMLCRRRRFTFDSLKDIITFLMKEIL